MREFWVSSGHQLARRAGGGGLIATDELLAAWLARPELAPPPEACAAERALHARLRAAPRAAVAVEDVAALDDADARENWGQFLAFRDLLAAAPTLEAAWLKLFAGRVTLAPVFIEQLTHLIARNALDGEEDPFVLRAAELLFRPQVGSLVDGALILADAETVQTLGKPASPLQAMFAGGAGEAQIDVMTGDNSWTYWSRSDAFSMALPIGAEPRARAGLARAMARWVEHLTGLDVEIEPAARFEAQDWRWFVGLDQEGTAIGDRLWRGAPEKTDAERVVALFVARLADDARLEREPAARPFPLILGMSGAKSLRMKPQNLIFGLPWRRGAGPS